MSTIYRKSGIREFYKVDEVTGIVTRVLNRKFSSRVDISDNRLIFEDATHEKDTQPSTEAEFNAALKEAQDRINSGRIEV